MVVGTATHKRRRPLKLAGVLLIGFAGYVAGYYFAPGVEDAQASLKHGTDLQATRTMSLPNRRVNAFAGPTPVLPGIDGQQHSLDEWRGKVIMLNFWATWCPPCQYEIPDFVRFQKTYGGRGLQIVGVGIDEARKLKNFARSLEMNYPVLVSLPTESNDILNNWGDSEQILPYTAVIDRDGRIVYIQRGSFTQATFDEFVLPLLKRHTASN